MKVLLATCWFPPTNIIGSVRTYQMARHLVDAGHSVHVIYMSGSGFPEDYEPDLEGIRCHAVDAGRIVRWLAPTTKNLDFRLVRGMLRRLFYPDQYGILRRRFLKMARSVREHGFTPDVVISSALPFSLHPIAAEIAQASGTPWVADNRDLWATSDYRRRSRFLRRFDVAYQRHVLRRADLVLAIGRNMARDLSALLGRDVVQIRNGADLKEAAPTPRQVGEDAPVRFVYTGVLYSDIRDIRPALAAIRATGIPSTVEFYGSEESVVRSYMAEYPDIPIQLRGFVSKNAIKHIQREADFLVVALGKSHFEKGVLTGKFFEYIESRRPIIAICDGDSEMAALVDSHGLGVASRDASEIAEYVRSRVRLGSPDLPPPAAELGRGHQMSVLEAHLKELVHEE